MDSLIDNFTMAQISWFAIVCYILHYAEEGPRLAKWLNSTYKKSEKMKARGIVYNQAKLNAENLILFFITLAIVIFLNIFPDNHLLQSLIMGSAIGFIGNTFFHAIPTVHDGIYSPGCVTACLLNPLFFYVVFHKAYFSGLLNLPNITIAAAMGLLLLPLVVVITHRVFMKNWIA